MTKPKQERQRKQPEGSGKKGNNADSVVLPMKLIKSLRRKGSRNNSEVGSNSSNAEGNNSDNSALVSLGNTSFGFNFDSEEGNASPPNSERNTESDTESGKGASNTDQKKAEESGRKKPAEIGNSSTQGVPKTVPQHQQKVTTKSSSSLTNDFPPSSSSSDDVGAGAKSGHNWAADEAVANLHSIASAYREQEEKDNKERKKAAQKETKARQNRQDNESKSGYNTDDEGASGFKRGSQKYTFPPGTSISEVTNSQDGNIQDDDNGGDGTSSVTPSQTSTNADANDGRPRKKKRFDEKKREERNAREKERSFRISTQINELRDLLSSGGIIVPKGTKSSVLTEAANYIRMLQQHQYRSELDRHQLVQQIQVIGGGAHGPQAAQAIRHVAAKNGVWSLGNFGGVPPKSAMSYYEESELTNSCPSGVQASLDPTKQTTIEEHEYRSVFNNCAVGMAIASMGGAFIDCNQLFCRLSNYTKQEVCSLTIFNMTARQDLQHAFDLISQLISPPLDGENADPQQPIVLRGAMKNQHDLGLGVALVKGDDGISKFFCVTLIKNPSSPFDESKPIPATIELIQGTPLLTKQQQMQKEGAGLDSSPAFTTG